MTTTEKPRVMKQRHPEIPEGMVQEGDAARLSNIQLYTRGEIDRLPKVKAGFLCNGRSADLLRYCSRRAGWGTSHYKEGRCKSHGGNSPVGAFSPQFKTGKYATWLPHHLASKYEKAMSDEQWIRLRNEIGLCDARLYDLTTSLNEASSVDLQRQMVSAYGKLREALDLGDGLQIIARVDELGTLIQQVKKDAQMWDEIGTWMDRRQRLTEAEVRHAVHTQSVMTARDVMVLVDQLVRIIRENVTDRSQLSRIASGIQAIIPTGTTLTVEPD